MKIEITGNLIALVFAVGLIIIIILFLIYLLTRKEPEKRDLTCDCDIDPFQCGKYCIWKRNIENGPY